MPNSILLESTLLSVLHLFQNHITKIQKKISCTTLYSSTCLTTKAICSLFEQSLHSLAIIKFLHFKLRSKWQLGSAYQLTLYLIWDVYCAFLGADENCCANTLSPLSARKANKALNLKFPGFLELLSSLCPLSAIF